MKNPRAAGGVSGAGVRQCVDRPGNLALGAGGLFKSETKPSDRSMILYRGPRRPAKDRNKVILRPAFPGGNARCSSKSEPEPHGAGLNSATI